MDEQDIQFIHCTMIIISDVINVSIINYKINVGKSTVGLKKNGT
jgi:hypothetical protein